MNLDSITRRANIIVACTRHWNGREYLGNAFARGEAADAVRAINHLLSELHELRSRLVTETRQSDDEAAARTDALLAEIRTDRNAR